MKAKLLLSVLNILTLCSVVTAVSAYFAYHSAYLGFIIVGLGIFCLVSLLPFSITLRTVYPDIVFGVIDNGILAVMAVFGGEFAGVMGAVLGGVVGNAVTDGIAGIFEGLTAERIQNKKNTNNRTILGSAVGKMSGCLLSAGLVLIIASLFKDIWR